LTGNTALPIPADAPEDTKRKAIDPRIIQFFDGEIESL